MKIEISYNEAMKIQQAQAVYYRQSIGRQGIKTIRKRTFCREGIDPNEPISVFEINEMVPRGGCFEGLIRHRPKERDQNAFHLHNAIRAGKVYSS